MSTVIQIENIWKEYRLGVIGHGTLTHDLESWWARVRGKEDPNSKITPMLAGQEKQIEGDHFWALRGINLEVKEGEILGIIGKNGAGKSTLLKILSRVTAPTKGNIKVKGRIASLLEVGTGFHPELTGRENIFMNGAILGMSKREIRSKLDEIIDFSGVEDFVDTPVKRYSSGMYVRLAFAVAAHLDPEILIIDEVLAVGDAEFQKKCLGKMNDVARAGRTVLFVSHNMGAIKSLCSHVIAIESGRVGLKGEPEKVVTNYLSAIIEKADQNCVSQRKDRSGNGLIRVVDVKCFFCREGKRWVVSIDYESSVPSWDDARLLVSIRSESGVLLTFFDSKSISSLPKNYPANGTIEITMSPDILFVSGSYFFNVACFCNEILCDHVINAATVRVDEMELFDWKNNPQKKGLFFVRQCWKIKNRAI